LINRDLIVNVCEIVRRRRWNFEVGKSDNCWCIAQDKRGKQPADANGQRKWSKETTKEQKNRERDSKTQEWEKTNHAMNSSLPELLLLCEPVAILHEVDQFGARSNREVVVSVKYHWMIRWRKMSKQCKSGTGTKQTKSKSLAMIQLNRGAQKKDRALEQPNDKTIDRA